MQFLSTQCWVLNWHSRMEFFLVEQTIRKFIIFTKLQHHISASSSTQCSLKVTLHSVAWSIQRGQLICLSFNWLTDVPFYLSMCIAYYRLLLTGESTRLTTKKPLLWAHNDQERHMMKRRNNIAKYILQLLWLKSKWW